MNPVTTATKNPEQLPLDILADLQEELRSALNSLGGKQPKAITDRYYLNAGGYINRAAEGFLVLRTAGRINASKLLIRPALEMMIRIEALRKQPELLYQFGFTESEDDKKWFRPAAARLGKPFDDKTNPPGWGEFETRFRQAFPNTQLKQQILSLADAARIAGLIDYYDTHYRMYCKYTHAALRATGGYLDDLSDPEDTRTMVNCTFSALLATAEIHGSAPQLKQTTADTNGSRGTRFRVLKTYRQCAWSKTRLKVCCSFRRTITISSSTNGRCGLA
jgi:hypothetical protein